MLFIWDSETTRNYGSGEIVVSAETVEEARQLVMAEVERLREAVKADAIKVFDRSFDNEYALARHVAYSIPYHDPDKDDWKAWEAKLDLVLSDIGKPPKTASVAFIRGSD